MKSLSEENYLKVIYRLSLKANTKTSITTIAEDMFVNPASVFDMLKKLVEKKHICYDKIKGAKLTERGNEIAVNIVRKHRLWEVFLLEKLGYGWDEIHAIAEELEHISDATLADRLDKFLSFPEYDPHGDPIPKANGKVAKPHSITLSDVKIGATCCVAAVRDNSKDFLEHLSKLGIAIGVQIKLIEKIAFDHSLIISVNNKESAIVSQKFSENIFIREGQ